MTSVYSMDKLMAETRRLAADYRRGTGKTLPVSGELAIFDACRLLNLDAAPAGCVDYDAVNAAGERVQVKGRCIFDETKGGQRLGQLRLDRDWAWLVVVLMNADYEPFEVYQVDRDAVADAAGEVSGSRRKRGPLSIARVKAIGDLVWSADDDPELNAEAVGQS